MKSLSKLGIIFRIHMILSLATDLLFTEVAIVHRPHNHKSRQKGREHPANHVGHWNPFNNIGHKTHTLTRHTWEFSGGKGARLYRKH